MKKITLTLLAMLGLLAQSKASDVILSVTNWNAAATLPGWVRLTWTGPSVIGNTVTVSPASTIYYPMNNVAPVARLLPGVYSLTVKDVTFQSPVLIKVPNDSLTYQLGQLITTNTPSTGGFSYITPGVQKLTSSGSSVAIAPGGGSGVVNLEAGAGFFSQRNPGLAGSGLNQGNLWYWTASTGDQHLTDAMKLYLSYDGELWFPATANAYDYRDPDWHTNDSTGPYNKEFAVQWDAVNKKFYGVYNYDPYHSNPNAQALGIAESTDLTNWVRKALIWPNGTTNGNGNTFAGTWFTDIDGGNYITYTHWDQSEGHDGLFDGFIIKRLDSTYAHWSAPVKILNNSDHSFTWDLSLINHNGQYELYWYGGPSGVATNNNLSSLFTFWKYTDLSEGEDSGENVFLVPITDQYWRLYSTLSGQGFLNGPAAYQESFDSGATWSQGLHYIPLQTNGFYFPPGILPPAYPGLSLSLSSRNQSLIANRALLWKFLNAPTNVANVGDVMTASSSITTRWASPTNHFASLTKGGFSGTISASGSRIVGYDAVLSMATPGFGLDKANGWITNLVGGPCEICVSGRVEPGTTDLFSFIVADLNASPIYNGVGQSIATDAYPSGFGTISFCIIRNLNAGQVLQVRVQSDNDDSAGSSVGPVDLTIRSLFQ